MSDPNADKTESAEKAYAEAAAEVKPNKAEKTTSVEPPETPAARAAAPTVAKKTAEPKNPAATASRKSSKPDSRPVASTPSVKAAKRAARVAKIAAKPAPITATKPPPTVTELKEKIMATAKNADFTQPLAEVVGEFQSRAKEAYEKSAEVATEVTEFTKGNVEALVESSKIFAAGAQSLGKTYVEEAKSAYETMTADMKQLAAVKSPTELFQLQGQIARRNFDALVATSSKNTEAFLKLANDAFAPLTGRVEVATEKLAKVA